MLTFSLSNLKESLESIIIVSGQARDLKQMTISSAKSLTHTLDLGYGFVVSKWATSAMRHISTNIRSRYQHTSPASADEQQRKRQRPVDYSEEPIIINNINGLEGPMNNTDSRVSPSSHRRTSRDSSTFVNDAQASALVPGSFNRDASAALPGIILNKAIEAVGISGPNDENVLNFAKQFLATAVTGLFRLGSVQTTGGTTYYQKLHDCWKNAQDDPGLKRKRSITVITIEGLGMRWRVPQMLLQRLLAAERSIARNTMRTRSVKGLHEC